MARLLTANEKLVLAILLKNGASSEWTIQRRSDLSVSDVYDIIVNLVNAKLIKEKPQQNKRMAKIYRVIDRFEANKAIDAKTSKREIKVDRITLISNERDGVTFEYK